MLMMTKVEEITKLTQMVLLKATDPLKREPEMIWTTAMTTKVQETIKILIQKHV